jgi:hypothetical protein
VETDDTNIESQLECEHSVYVDNIPFQINASLVIEKYEWYKNRVKIEQEKGKYLKFYGINQQKNNGTYKCNIILKNRKIIESESFNLIVYKCNYQLLASCLFPL